MKKSLLLMPLFMAFLCGCKESSTIQTYQPPINVETSVVNEESTVKKTTKASSKTSTKTTKTATTTTTTAPKTNTSTIKDLIIDGNGNLVATKSNNTFAIIGNVQGEKGAKGDTGERGAQGEKGQDGRGIDHCELDADKNLIIYYTDGTSQNVGCVSVAETTTHDYEQVGYEVHCATLLPDTNEDYDLSITDCTITLVSINESVPSQKYNYKVVATISPHNHASGSPQHVALFGTDLDNASNTLFFCNHNSTDSPTIVERHFTSPIPCVQYYTQIVMDSH